MVQVAQQPANVNYDQTQQLTSATLATASTNRTAMQQQLAQPSNGLREFNIAEKQRHIYSKGIEISVPHGTPIEILYQRRLADGSRARGRLGVGGADTTVVDDKQVARLGISRGNGEVKYTLGLYQNFTGTLTIKVGDQTYQVTSGTEIRAQTPTRAPFTTKPAPPKTRSDTAKQQAEQPSPDQTTDPQTAKDYQLLRELQSKAAAADKKADQLVARGEALARSQDSNIRFSMPAAFNRFLTAYSPYIARHVPPAEKIIEQLGLPRSAWGSNTIIEPADINRPGVIITSDDKSAKLVDQAVAELRGATTATLLLDGREEDLRKTRANSMIVFKADQLLEEGIALANKRLAALPEAIAAQATQRALDTTANRGIFPRRAARLAPFRTERAAAGGIGAPTFEGGLNSGFAEAQRSSAEAVASATEIVKQRALAFAYREAAKAKEIAIQVWKDDRFGCRANFTKDNQTEQGALTKENQVGVNYFIRTAEGRDYYLRDLGKPQSYYRDPENYDQTEYHVPAEVYGRFNVDILTAYDQGKEAAEADAATTEPFRVSRAQLYEIAMQSNIFPTEDGDMIYLDPDRYGAEKLEQLKSLAKQKGTLTIQDVKSAMSLQ